MEYRVRRERPQVEHFYCHQHPKRDKSQTREGNIADNRNQFQ